METHAARRAHVLLVNNMPLIKDVTVTYPDGTSDSGFVRQAGGNGDRIVLCRHSVVGNADPYRSSQRPPPAPRRGLRRSLPRQIAVIGSSDANAGG